MMSNSILILGESGTGKSSSLRNLNPEETFIINVVAKPLPFKGSSKKYTKLSTDGLNGNYYATDNIQMILRIINLVNKSRPDIKNIVLDDFGYTISNSFMRKASQKGYDKFVELSTITFDVLTAIRELREDLFCYVMMHTEIDTHGRYKPRTIGKMTDQYICIEGHFTYVFHALIQDSGYKFLTNNDGTHMAKTPIGMFEDLHIDNDLNLIRATIEGYYNDE